MTRLVPVVVALALCSMSLPARAASDLPSESDRWIELKSEHFVFYSSAPERVATKLATRVERLRQVLAELGGDARLRTPRPLELFLFRDERSYRPFRLPGPDGKPADWSAYYMPNRDRDTIVLYDTPFDDGDPIGQSLSTYLFALIGANFERIPSWANYGLASLYGTFMPREDAGDIGRPVSHFVAALTGKPRFASAELLALGRGETERLERSRYELYRAQSWLTTHYLLFGRPERRGDLRRYLDAIEKGADPVASFPAAFGLTPAQLDEQLEIVLRKRNYPFVTVRFADLPPLAAFAVRDMAYPEVLARQGDLARRLSPASRPRGVALLEEARRRDPKSPLPPLGLALVRLDEHDDAGAEALLEESLTLAPDFEPSQAALGSLLMRGGDGRTVDATRVARARDLLTRATATQPDRLESWIALGRAELGEGGDAGRAAAAFENAWRRAPERSDLLGWYTMALSKDGQHALAASLLRSTLLKSPDPEDRISGERYLKQVVEQEVWALANAGRLEEAQARIAENLAASPDPELAKSLNETHARIESQIGGRDCVDDYNSGIRAANEQKFAEARPLFEKVVAGCTTIDPALVEQAKQVLADIEKFEKKRKR